MCSSTRGPASAPSLVTWPTSTIAQPLRLGDARQLRRAFAHLGHRARRRVSWSDYTVWIESMTQKAGCSVSIVGDDLLQLDLGQHPHLRPSSPSRRARSATCAPLSSPVTYSTFIRARQRIQRLQQQRALADARVAADQHHAAGDDAAAEHAVELFHAGRRALDIGRLDLRQRGHRLRLAPATGSGCFAGASATVSSSVFQALQLRALAQPLGGSCRRIRGRCRGSCPWAWGRLDVGLGGSAWNAAEVGVTKA